MSRKPFSSEQDKQDKTVEALTLDLLVAIKDVFRKHEASANTALNSMVSALVVITEHVASDGSLSINLRIVARYLNDLADKEDTKHARRPN
jgi:hypothetical protein